MAQHAATGMQDSMNSLFQCQQVNHKLDEAKRRVKASKGELKAMKQRLIEKEKERREYKQQCDEKGSVILRQEREIVELNKIIGMSSEDFGQIKNDAMCASSLMDELSDCKQENKLLRKEVKRLSSTTPEDYLVVQEESPGGLTDKNSGMLQLLSCCKFAAV